MLKRFLSLLLVATCCLMSQAEVNPRPFTIPAIHEWKGGTGTLTLTPQSRILYADVRLRAVAEALARDLKTTGITLPVVEGKKAAVADILFIYKPLKKLGDEGYTIDILYHFSFCNHNAHIVFLRFSKYFQTTLYRPVIYPVNLIIKISMAIY